MFKKTSFWVVAITMAGAILVALPAAGAVHAISYLRMNQINVMEDVDFESAVKYNSTTDEYDPVTELDEGAILYGMWEIQSLFYVGDNERLNLGDPGPFFTIAFGIKVADAPEDVTIDGVDAVKLTYEPLSDTDWDTLMDTTNNTQLTRQDSDTILKMFDDPDGIDPTVGSTEQDAMATVDGTALWEFGFIGDDDEFWISLSGSADVPPALFLDYGAALNITHAYSSIPLKEHDHYSGNPGNAVWANVGDAQITGDWTHPAQFQIEGSLGTHGTGNFVAPTETDVAILPVPEPASIIAWSILAVVASCGIGMLRRRKLAR